MAITYDDLKICAELINEVRDAQERADRLRAQLERCTPRMSATGDRHTNTFNDKYADVLQKIIINADRNKEAKKEKDRDSILALFPHLDKAKFSMLLERTTKKQRKAIENFRALNPIIQYEL